MAARGGGGKKGHGQRVQEGGEGDKRPFPLIIHILNFKYFFKMNVVNKLLYCIEVFVFTIMFG